MFLYDSKKQIRGMLLIFNNIMPSVLVLACLVFSPPLALFISSLFLIFLSVAKEKKEYTDIIAVCLFTIVMSNLIYVVSMPSFLIASDDFSSYYEHYLCFLNSPAINECFFIYSGGAEIIYPLINYVFSLIIGGPYPYALKAMHALMNFVFFFAFYIFLIKKYQLSVDESILLICCMLLLYKIPQGMQLMRQAYASYFIIMAVIIENKKSKLALLIIATLFHLSSIPIYFLISYIWNINNQRQVFLVSLLSILIAVAIYLLAGSFSADAFSGNFLLRKLSYSLTEVTELENVKKAFLSGIKQSIYMILSLFVLFISRKKEVQGGKQFKFFLMACILAYIPMNIIPAFGNRIFMPIFYPLLGFIFYIAIRNVSVYAKVAIMLSILCFLNYNWIFNNGVYYYKYPMAGNAFYYLPTIYERVNYSVDRAKLSENTDVINPFR